MNENEDEKGPSYSVFVTFPEEKRVAAGVQIFIEKVNEIPYSKSMTELEAKVVADLSSGNFTLSDHAEKQAAARSISQADIQRAAQEWLDCYTPPGTEKVHVIGKDYDGAEIEIVAVDDGGTLVVTVIGERHK